MASLRTVHAVRVHAEGLGSLEGIALVVSFAKHATNLLLRETQKSCFRTIGMRVVNILF